MVQWGHGDQTGATPGGAGTRHSIGTFRPGPLQHRRAPESSDKLRREGIELAYNLDHDRAIELLRRAVAMAPDDPAAHCALASVLWLNILFRRGAVTVDHYLGLFSRAQVDLSRPPPELDSEFRKEVARAIELAEGRVAARRKDAQAHYDLGAAVGLQASYIATVEGKLLTGFNSAKRAFDEHEKVLDLDSTFADAGLVVGTYRYVVSTLSLPDAMDGVHGRFRRRKRTGASRCSKTRRRAAGTRGPMPCSR